GDAAGELPHRVQFLVLRIGAALGGVLVPALLRQVLRDDAESGGRPAAAAHGRQHAFRPKARSVLPHLPGLGLGPALGLRLRNEPGNETGRRGLWREDAAAIAI